MQRVWSTDRCVTSGRVSQHGEMRANEEAAAGGRHTAAWRAAVAHPHLVVDLRGVHVALCAHNLDLHSEREPWRRSPAVRRTVGTHTALLVTPVLRNSAGSRGLRGMQVWHAAAAAGQHVHACKPQARTHRRAAVDAVAGAQLDEACDGVAQVGRAVVVQVVVEDCGWLVGEQRVGEPVKERYRQTTTD